MSADSGVPLERDPGLQPERTALAWQRTALSISMIALLLAFACLRGGFLPGTIASSAVAVAAAAVLTATRRAAVRHHRLSPWSSLARVAVLLVLVAAIGAVFGLVVLWR